jgi:two-component system alkaline phosphatase synthesis response regulator PhoP
MAKKILVVDDEKDIIRELEFILLKKGFEVITAENGQAALDLVKTNKPDLVLLDLFMPVCGGVQFGKEFKTNSETKNIPVILLTASADNIQEKKIECMADDYALKPFDYKEVMKKIYKFLT